MNNKIAGQHNVISGGRNNEHRVPTGRPTEPVDQNKCKDSAIVGGNGNLNLSTGSVIGGEGNCVMEYCNFSTVFGINHRVRGGYAVCLGGDCYIGNESGWCAIGGGFQNKIGDAFPDGTMLPTGSGQGMHGGWIGGGQHNTIHGLAKFGSIGGGSFNSVGGVSGAIAGGFKNQVTGRAAAIPGGQECKAHGDYSWANGYRAHAHHDHSFVFNGDLSDGFMSERNGQFAFNVPGGVRFQVGRLADVRLHPGAGSWSMNFDEASMKSGADKADASTVLTKLAELEVLRFSYKGQGNVVKHFGPSAAKFSEAFEVGEDTKTINTGDALGVCMLAIQALSAKVDQQQSVIDVQQRRIEQMYRVMVQEHGGTGTLNPEGP